jgi:hypothetical protein
MALYKGILSFPTIFTPKIATGATDAKFNLSLLIRPDDPQVAALKAEIEAAKLASFPNGYTGTDECFQPYDTKYANKDYYDSRFSGWWVLSCSAKSDDKPSVVDEAMQPIIDPSAVYSGMLANVHMGISGYIKGRGGIGGWLNGVQILDVEPPMGRLDGKPSVEAMFGGASTAPPAATAPAATPVMTAAANGVTYDAHIAAGWTDEKLIAAGLAIAPSFA